MSDEEFKALCETKGYVIGETNESVLGVDVTIIRYVDSVGRQAATKRIWHYSYGDVTDFTFFSTL